MVILIIGGARSGKTRFALELAAGLGGKKAYLATGLPCDEEMAARIARHREERSNLWTTFEEPVAMAKIISEIDGEFSVMLLDCLTIWLNNLMLAERDVAADTQALVSSLTRARATVLVVTNEVGQGIVPENALARRFRDEAGRLNQAIAASAREVYLVTAGIPLKLK